MAEAAIRDALAAQASIPDSVPFAEKHGFAHADLIGTCKSLASGSFIVTSDLSRTAIQLTKEGQQAAELGSPEARVWALVPAAGGILQDDLTAAAGADLAKVGMAKAVQAKWLSVVKEEGAVETPAPEGGKKKAAPKRVMRAAESIDDTVQAQLKAVLASGGAEGSVAEADFTALKKRSLLSKVTVKSVEIKPGEKFGQWGTKAVVDVTHEMLVKGTWRTATFKPLNFEAAGKPPNGGCLHPLMKVRSMFREIFLEMGFEEMVTNKFVESSFWNFDALYQPQQHPARDEHDTFFIKTPAATLDIPRDYLERVRATHERGGNELGDEYASNSTGWGYDWSEDVTRTQLLRTHTTAVSSRTLYALAQLAKQAGRPGEVLQPQKYFSIDRVFRNEALDATHLAEFHQVEGFVIGEGLSLSHLMGTIQDFFRRLGPEFQDMKFKPTYNPYTEPSMEFHCFHPGLKKWVEVGNSGVFRPEMLRPMGFEPSVSVIAWGMSLERPTMIKYKYKDIRALFGHRIDLNMTRAHPVVRWT